MGFAQRQHRLLLDPIFVVLPRGKTRGIRIVGGRVTDWDVTMGDGFVPCPVAEALGIPLLVKRERGTGEECFIQLASRFMSNP